MEFILAILGVVLIVYASIIKFKKNISIIPAVNEERIKKIKKVDKVADDFGNRAYMLAGSIIVLAVASKFFGNIGAIAGFIVVIVAAASWNSLSTSIDEKIKKREY